MLFIENKCSISILVAVAAAAVMLVSVISSSFHCGLSYSTHISTTTTNLNYTEHLFMKKPINLNIYVVWQIKTKIFFVVYPKYRIEYTHIHVFYICMTHTLCTCCF